MGRKRGDAVGISFNAAKSVSSSDVLEGLIEDLTMHEPNWWVIFILEVDGVLSDNVVLECGQHRVFRHYPGAGSFAMLTMVRSCKRLYLHSLEARGRAMKVSFELAKQSFSQTFVCVHGGHGDALGPSLADAAAILCKSIKRDRPLIVLGDMNVDLLPILASDPYVRTENRAARHVGERILHSQFLDSNSLLRYVFRILLGILVVLTARSSSLSLHVQGCP